MRVTGDHRGAGTKALSPWEVESTQMSISNWLSSMRENDKGGGNKQ